MKSFKNIKLLVFDIDGVLTDGRKYLALDGTLLFKGFLDKDLTALKKLQEHFEIIFLSGDTRVNQEFARLRGIRLIYELNQKGKVLKELLFEKGLTTDQVVFVGDDLIDLECIKLIPFSLCPSDAVLEVKKEVGLVLKAKGGCGVVVEIYNMFQNSKLGFF